MFETNSLWFEIAVVSIIFAAGNILIGHFEERTPKLRRIGKYVMMVAITCIVSFYFGRTTAMIMLSLLILPVAYIHGYYLPKEKGING